MAWNPPAEAVYVEAVREPGDTNPRSVLVEHFDAPCVKDLPDAKPSSLFTAAHDYLRAASALPQAAAEFEFPKHWLDALDPGRSGSEPFFGWMPHESGDAGARSLAPYGSFHVEDGTGAMLFASERVDRHAYMGSGFGIAVPVHLRDDGSGGLQACFHGFAASLPYGWFHSAGLSPDKGIGFSFTLASLLPDQEARTSVAAATGLDNVVFRGVRVAVPDDMQIELDAVGVRTHAGVQVPYAVKVQGIWTKGGEHSYTPTQMTPLFADAAPGSASVFVDDPGSRAGKLVRPTREELGVYRDGETIGPVGRVELAHPPGAPLVTVMPCPEFSPVDKPLNAKNPRPVDLPGTDGTPAVRSDDASAVQVFFHARDLVERLKAYGWKNPAGYFRVMRPEVRILYRSAIVPGPGKDGRTVNARVIPEGWPRDATGGQQQGGDPRPAIFIHVAAANLRRRERKPWAPGGDPSPAIPFGLGADRRWLWHEFGHVLLVASTGELEFRFAHSAGDALAAIVADPGSKLRDATRTFTFPFVFLPRYHNRCAHAGWSWTGTQHAALAAVTSSMPPRRKGYASEQILSSSLFRLYRCMGGDTSVPGERLRASHYALYLIMKAISLMGDARVHVVATPAQFVHLLLHADVYAGKWSAKIGADTFARIGGTARKVIRWAFEAQGLYGTGDAIGAPPKVDIYIRDNRPTGDDQAWGGTDYGPGGYVPVSLDWPGAGEPAALWQADARAGIVVDGGKVEVVVSNRGSSEAKGVQVELRRASWNADPGQLLWNSAAWTSIATSGPEDISAGDGPKTFTFNYTPPAGSVLLAIATCPADRANTDAVLGLPCSTFPTPIVDLVANDNNLGLLVVP